MSAPTEYEDQKRLENAQLRNVEEGVHEKREKKIKYKKNTAFN